jgi:hypothetical protein
MFNKESFMNEFMGSVKLAEEECSALVEEWKRTKDKDTLEKLIKGLYLKIVSIISAIPGGSRFEDITEDIFQDIVLLLIEHASTRRNIHDGCFILTFEEKATRMVRRKYGNNKGDVFININCLHENEKLDILSTLKIISIEKEIDLKSLREEVAKLPDRERTVVGLYFGLDGSPMTFESIGRKYNYTS